jgi:hypothetical protein
MTLDALFQAVTNEFGLVLFTAVGVALMAYLAYSMAHAETE